jgi:hypothetical protein
MQELKTKDSVSQSFENVIRGNCYQYSSDWFPISMVLIPISNIANLSFEIDLNDISNNIRSKHPN